MLMLEFASQGEKAAPIPVVAAETRGDTPVMAEEQAVASASAKAMKQAQSAAQPGPAALDPDGHGIEVLEEGGLLEGKIYSGRRISLDFKDVDIDDVLRLIAEVSDLNIIAGDEVQGQVTIRLVDVPWDQALDVILLTKGLGFVRVGNVLRIAPSDLLKGEEEARLQEKRAKEKLEDLVVKLQPVNYADVKEVAKMIKRLLSSRGTVDIDARTNTVILKDIPNVIEEATALIKAIDTQTPQVMIEAKIVEANLDYLREVGSRWGVGVQPFTDAFDPGSAFREDAGSRDFRLQPVQDILGNSVAPNNIAVSNPITELATGVVNVGAFLLDDRFNLDVELEAAESEGEGKVISSPRVVTLDNRKASIEQGVSIPFQTFENGDAKLEFIDAVLRLDVTPHITQDNSIIMKIEVQRNAPDDSVPTSTGSPAIAKNEAETETLVRDGQTLVIGGIYVVRSAERQSRVPYFHKIPIIGNAFKSNEVRDARQELLVFVTPRVVVNPEMGS
jgi:type IV pilus assembly protein PilQ